jgi:electron transfer flavoprotein alpha subunit
MSVLIYLESSEGAVKKSSLEALCYGVKVAETMGKSAEALVLGEVQSDLSALGAYGVKKVHHASSSAFNRLDAGLFAAAVAEAAGRLGAEVVVLSNNLTGKAVAPRLSVRLKAGLVAGAVTLPDLSLGFTVKRNVFSGKAFANVSILTPVKILSLQPNAFPVTAGTGAAEVISIYLPAGEPRVKVTETRKVKGTVPLGEAEMVVSGGRGLKGPENWGLVEDLAGLLGAATACSRAVADAHWRPHHEHVGQTGLAIAPNLYFAIGISGAIQHLAGVNRSKVIVVVNKDPEAPFFKAADYGIVGDAFEVMPRVIEAVRQLKAR